MLKARLSLELQNRIQAGVQMLKTWVTENLECPGPKETQQLIQRKGTYKTP